VKLKFRISLLVIAIMAATVAALSTVVLVLATSGRTTLYRENAARFAREKALEIKNQYDTIYYLGRGLQHIMNGFESLPPETRRRRFNADITAVLAGEAGILEAYTVWRDNAVDGDDDAHRGEPGATATGRYCAAFTRENGRVAVSTYNDHDLPFLDARLEAMKERGVVLGDLRERAAAGKILHVFTINLPITNKAGEVAGLLSLTLDTSRLQALVENIIASDAALRTATVYTNKGDILANLRPQRAGKNIVDGEPALWGEYLPQALDAIQRGRSFSALQQSGAVPEPVYIFMEPFVIAGSDTSWAVMLGISRKAMLRQVTTMRNFTIIFSSIMLVAAGFIIYLVISGVTRPAVKMAQTLRDISQGAGDLTRRIAFSSKDEIGDLARYFNETLEKIRHLVTTIKGQAASLFEIGAEMASNMSETAAAVNQITGNIRAVKGRVLNQSAGVNETHATMEQITANIDTLNALVETQAESVSQSSAAIEEMIANIRSVTQMLARNAGSVQILTESSGAGRAGLQEVAADIREIARESEGLLEINGVMENIASQTNLLSMNAAIEAAHAGEAGKGFAVVADEIRKLAESSGEQSKTISAVLRKIKSSIDKITLSTDGVLSKFETIDTGVRTVTEQTENIRDAMEEQSQGSQQILEVLGKLNTLTQQVKSGAEQMLEGSAQVIRESRNLEKATAEIADSMNEMSGGAEQINAAVSRVNGISDQNRAGLDVLVTEVARFKV